MTGNYLEVTFAISVLVQAGFFGFAASLKTDKVTDLSYSVTFILLALVLLFDNDPSEPAQAVIAAMVVLWGVRLGVYLLLRIILMKRDPRFDGIREDLRRFARFWLLQGVVVWVVMLPVTIWFSDPGGWGALRWPGLLVWSAGLVIETVADLQKFRHKTRAGVGWTCSGLWRYSRHPNYFGELLCWWGVFLFVLPDLAGWEWAAVAGPLTLTFLLLRVTGVPPLRKRAVERWGDDPRYREYVRSTRLLVPWPVFRRPTPRRERP